MLISVCKYFNYLCKNHGLCMSSANELSLIVLVIFHLSYVDMSPSYPHFHDLKQFHMSATLQIANKHICSVHNNLSAVILIKNRVYASEVRYEIRKTLMDEARKYDIPTMFVMGLPQYVDYEEILRMENLWHNDIIQGSFIDSYYNLTLKTMTALHWTLTYCNNAKFLILLDDDIMLNFPLLISKLKNGHFDNQISGFVFRNNEVEREKGHKYGVSSSAYPTQYYPTFASGGVLVFDQNILNTLNRTAYEKCLPAIYLDDVYVGILVNESEIKININSLNSQMGSDRHSWPACCVHDQKNWLALIQCHSDYGIDFRNRFRFAKQLPYCTWLRPLRIHHLYFVSLLVIVLAAFLYLRKTVLKHSIQLVKLHWSSTFRLWKSSLKNALRRLY